MSAAPGAPAWLIPRARPPRPAPRPVPGGPAAAGHRPARPPLRSQAQRPRPGRTNAPAPDDLLALQDRLLQLLRAGEPAAITSVGQPATPAQYFADLRLVCSLMDGAWPHSQTLITGPGMADCLDQYIASTGGAAPRRHTLCDTPPLDARPAAALITAAVGILDGDDLQVLGELLAPARDGASRKSPRGRWIRRYQRAGHDCSDGFQRARAPGEQLPAHRPALTRTPGTGPPVTFAPEHIPEHLQDDWHHEHFRHISGNTRLLRRAAALRLVQMSAGGSLAQAAAFLGIDNRYLKTYPGSAAFAADPAQFRLAVHALARQLSATPDLINYGASPPRHGRK